MTTMDNAKDAFAGESQANRKYTNFSEKAAAEGFTNVSKLFKAAAEAEAIHAKRLLFVMQKVGSTEENLKGSVEGETDEFETMYPSFVEMAEKEGESEAKTVFTHAMKAEEVHAKKYTEALEAVSNGDDLKVKKIFLCPVCGNIEFDEIPEQCPICGVPARMFKEIE
ncbi:rubrerythrin family protein [Methanomicrobium antiquum]|uniref:Rubrerythrin family protein n=1 Tax=Methanomicrobium antiquum TaxID=487686 RepID=A0AAF0FNU6_9EURY|nr:rubrerythrin family protein [Methanomicrobium antiquum]WFN36877.1 rubrerythrin family protein [Methanomicrobium antiquum]